MMISYMESHQLFARGQITSLGRSGNDKYKLMWKELTAKLNKLVKVQKDDITWMNCWKRLRINAKERKAKYLYSLQKTGNTNENISLSELDQRISNIFGHYGTGLCILPELRIAEEENSNYHQPSVVNPSVDSVMIDNVNLQIRQISKKEEEMFQKFHEEITMCIHEIKEISQRHRSTKAQHALLLSLMERNPLLTRDELEYDISNEKWIEIMITLNSIGTEDQSVEAWKRTWHDKVRLVKDKKKEIESGNNKLSLSDVELRILKCIGEEVIYLMSPSVASTLKYQTSSKSLKRSYQSFDLTHDEHDEAAKKVAPSTIDIATANNEIISNLATMLIESFQAQNKILEQGFENIQTNIGRLCSEISTVFELYKESQFQQSHAIVLDKEGEPGSEPEYLDEEFLRKHDKRAK